MNIIIQIETENLARCVKDEEEVPRILKELAEKFKNGICEGCLHDKYRNVVGSVYIKCLNKMRGAASQ